MEKTRILKTKSMIIMSVSFDNIDDMLQQQAIMEELAETHKEMLSEVEVVKGINIDEEDKIYTYSELSIKKFALN